MGEVHLQLYIRLCLVSTKPHFRNPIRSQDSKNGLNCIISITYICGCFDMFCGMFLLFTDVCNYILQRALLSTTAMTVILNVVSVLEMRCVTVTQAIAQKDVQGIGRNPNVMVRHSTQLFPVHKHWKRRFILMQDANHVTSYTDQTWVQVTECG